MVAAAILKNQKNQTNSTPDWQILAKFGMMMHLAAPVWPGPCQPDIEYLCHWKKGHTTLEMVDNAIYSNFEYVNLVSYCHFASQTSSTKVRKVDFTALNRLTQLQRRTIDSMDRLDRFQGL